LALSPTTGVPGGFEIEFAMSGVRKQMTFEKDGIASLIFILTFG